MERSYKVYVAISRIKKLTEVQHARVGDQGINLAYGLRKGLNALCSIGSREVNV